MGTTYSVCSATFKPKSRKFWFIAALYGNRLNDCYACDRALVKRWGCRPLIAVATILLMVLLPSLTIWHSLVSMAVALFILVRQQVVLALLSIYKQLWWKSTAYVRSCLVFMVCVALAV